MSDTIVALAGYFVREAQFNGKRCWLYTRYLSDTGFAVMQDIPSLNPTRSDRLVNLFSLLIINNIVNVYAHSAEYNSTYCTVIMHDGQKFDGLGVLITTLNLGDPNLITKLDNLIEWGLVEGRIIRTTCYSRWEECVVYTTRQIEDALNP